MDRFFDFRRRPPDVRVHVYFISDGAAVDVVVGVNPVVNKVFKGLAGGGGRTYVALNGFVEADEELDDDTPLGGGPNGFVEVDEELGDSTPPEGVGELETVDEELGDSTPPEGVVELETVDEEALAALALTSWVLRFSNCSSCSSSSLDNLVAALIFFESDVLAAFECAAAACAFVKLNVFFKLVIFFSNSSTLAPPRIFLPLLAFTVLFAIESSTSFQEFKCQIHINS